MNITPNQMCFGMSENLDKASFLCFLKQIGRDEFCTELSNRASSEDIEIFVNQFTALMKKHFSEHEYHTLFLNDPNRMKHHGDHQ